MTEEDREVLKTMGFTETVPGFWQHKFLGLHTFDFSSASLEGTIKYVFDGGVAAGGDAVREELRSVLRHECPGPPAT